MKKLLVTLALAGTLSAPSVVFAEASWYGSLRGGIEFSGGNTDFYDGASRWGIKGSAEASEGLTAVYRFEHKFSTSDAGQAGGRLAYVGLSGGFGTLTLGQIWSASYNHAGAIRDFPNWYTSPDTTGRIGNALSYSVSNDAFSMQIDAIMDGKKNTGGAVDQLEFGMTVNVGEVGKVALAHTTVKDETVMVMPTIEDWLGTFEPNTPTTVGEEGMPNTPYAPGTDGTDVMHTAMMGTGEEAMEVSVVPITVFVLANNELYTDFVSGDTEPGEIDPMALTETNLRATDNGIQRLADGRYTAGALTAQCNADGDADTIDDNCVSFTAYVHRVIANDIGTAPIGGGAITPPTGATVGTETYYAPADVETTAATDGDDPTTGEPNTPTTVGEEGTAARFGAAPEPTMDVKPGHKASHISAEFGLGAITTAVGYSEKKMNDAVNKTKTTFIGAKGGIGDTGLSWGAYSRVIDKAGGGKEKPWTIGLSKSLGGGAWAYIEHHNDGKKGDSSRSTAIALGVSF